MKTLQEFFVDILRNTKLYELALKTDKYEKIIEDELYNIIDDLVVLNCIKITNLDVPIHSKSIMLECLNSSIWLAGKFKIGTKTSYKRKLRMVNKVCDEIDAEKYDWHRRNEAVYSIGEFCKDFKWSLPSNVDVEDLAKISLLESIKQLKEIKHLIAAHDSFEIEKWINKIFNA